MTLEPMTAAKAVEIYDCGICGHYHRAAWNGDCREDAERFTLDQIEERFGSEGVGWVEVSMPE